MGTFYTYPGYSSSKGIRVENDLRPADAKRREEDAKTLAKLVMVVGNGRRVLALLLCFFFAVRLDANVIC